MKKQAACLIIALLFFAAVKAQTYLEPYLGFQMDLNNTNHKFKQLNTGLQVSFKSKGTYEFALQAQYGLPITEKSAAAAYTSSPSLPVMANAAKKIKPAYASFAVQNRIAVAGGKTANTFYVVLGAGVAYQNIKVRYSYDKTNYVVLNPDKTLAVTGTYMAGGFMYIHKLQQGRIFAALNFNTPALGATTKYPSSFKFMAPASISAGYSIIINNKKNDSK